MDAGFSVTVTILCSNQNDPNDRNAHDSHIAKPAVE
jgi:hypothetical protein